MLGEIGGLVNTAARYPLEKFRNYIKEGRAQQQINDRINQLTLEGLNSDPDEKLDFNTELDQQGRIAAAAANAARLRNEAEREHLYGLTDIRGIAQNQKLKYEMGLGDAQTQNEINKMTARQGLVRPLLRDMIDYDTWAKGASDYDQLQAILKYSSGENAANRALQEKERNQKLVGGLINNLLMGAAQLFS